MAAYHLIHMNSFGVRRDERGKSLKQLQMICTLVWKSLQYIFSVINISPFCSEKVGTRTKLINIDETANKGIVQ